MPGTKARVLLLDDEPNILLALKRTLARDGYEVTTAETPEAAFLALRSGGIDVVVSDHLMPTMTGLEFLRLVRDRFPEPVRIMLTGQADTQTAIAAINEGEIYRFMTKPWDDAELKAVLFSAAERVAEQREQRKLLTQARVGHLKLAVG